MSGSRRRYIKRVFRQMYGKSATQGQIRKLKKIWTRASRPQRVAEMKAVRKWIATMEPVVVRRAVNR